MVAAALPSTLVKCLYLFFDLPELGTDVAAGTEVSPQESRSLLQKVFVQVGDWWVSWKVFVQVGDWLVR